MSADHVIWRSVAGTKYCALGPLAGVPKQFQINQGISRADGFPKDARFEMNKRFPKQVALPDSALNAGGLVVVSGRLKDFIEARSPRDIEYLPVSIINHKGRNAGVPYWVLSPLAIVDCIDQGASDLMWNAIDPKSISAANKLVLDVKAIPADLLLFRMKFFEDLVVLRKDVADAIVAEGFTGVHFVRVDQFPE